MRKRIAKLLRLLASKFSAEATPREMNFTFKNYEIKKIATSVHIRKEEYEGMKSFCKNLNGGVDVSDERLKQLLISREGGYFKESLLLAIKDGDLIEFEFDQKSLIASAKMYVCVPVSQHKKEG